MTRAAATRASSGSMRARVPVRLAVALVSSGVLAGLVAAGLTVVLHLVQHLAFGYAEGSFQAGVLSAPPARRVVALTVCGVVAGVGWYLFGRFARPSVRVRTSVRERTPMRPASTIVESLLQIVVVGLGASLGRESAPRRISAALAQLWGQRLRLRAEDARLVVACAAGAGFGAVYSVPAAGALFTLEVLLRSRRPAHVVAAVLTAVVASVVAWIEVDRGPFYSLGGVDGLRAWSWALLLAAVLAGPVAAAAGLLFETLTHRAGTHRARGPAIVLTAVVVFTALGVLALAVPSLLGNGRGPAQLAFDDARTVPVLLLLAVAKPLVTAACLRTGATGGLVTPAIATGALLGAGLGALWHMLFSSSPIAGVALVMVAGVLTVTLRAPLTAIVLAIELTAPPVWLVVPVVVAAAGAWTASRGWRRVPTGLTRRWWRRTRSGP